MSQRTSFLKGKVAPTVLSLLAVASAGLGSKFYVGTAQHWVNDSLAGMFYVVFWCLTVFLVLRAPQPSVVAACVLLVTSGLEVLQLWNPRVLASIRASFVGRAFVGSSFDWLDFPHYVAGAILGWLWMRWLASRWFRSRLSILDEPHPDSS